MNHRPALSPKFNLSLGLLPGVIVVIACLCTRPGTCIPLLVEGIIFLPALLLLLFGRRWSGLVNPRRYRFIQGIEAAIVSARILFILVLVHGVMALLVLPFAPTTAWKAILCEYTPLGVLALPILLNQIGLYYFNKRLNRITFIPVVNTQGEVIGKKPLLATILRSDRKTIYPVVRIAITACHMLYLSPRPQTCLNEQGKTDLPLEGYPLYGEDIGQTAQRLLRSLLPQAPSRNLRYHFKYYYRDDTANRLVYLFTFEAEDDDALREGKLWTLRQIRQNLGKHYFCKFLEYEYELLKDLICTREKYRGS